MACSLHLSELEDLFEQVVYEASGNVDTLYDGALAACPDLVLHHSDEYMACLVNELSRQGHNNIFVLCGYGQSRTIPYHLYYNPRAFNSNDD